MSEWRLFDEGTIPEWTRPDWYASRERAPHLEQDLHRGRLLEAFTQIQRAAATHKAKTLVDLGAGDGGLLSLLYKAPGEPAWDRRTAWGYDLQPTNIEGAAQRGVPVHLGDAVAGIEYLGTGDDGTTQATPIEWGDIAVATEILEHLLDPHTFVREIAKHSRILVASSPWNERPGTAYEFHTWAFDPDGYRALLEQAGYEVICQAQSGMFQVVTGILP